jgi:hypothetical protein
MSLALAAKHLESQGRGKDTQLVHMTPSELKALNKLSIDSIGKPLSTNPKTGLPEAGFLDAILPTVLGAAGTAIFGPGALPFIAGGIGLASYAMTGDIGSGILAGLGAWSGGKLTADIKGAADLAQVGGNSATAASDAAAKAALDPSVYTPTSTIGSPSILGKSALIDTTGGLSNIGAAGTTNALGQTVAPQMARQVTSAGFSAAPITEWDKFTAGLEGVKQKPMEFLSRPGVGWNTAMAASPLVFSALEQPNYMPPKKDEEENPFGLKRLSPDFQGSFPTQPNPYFTAQYPDYRTKPYGAADGGLMDINSYAKGKKVDYSRAAKSAQDLESGVSMATRRPIVDLPTPDVGIYADERKYANMDPYERALSMLKDIKGSSGISSRGLPNMKGMPTLGTISTDPAMVEAELAEQAKRQIVQEAKRGGLMDGHLGDYSDGGRLLKGPGDGVSDSIPATIGGKQAARLAEGEFVIPARIVSELGNGSTDAGAKRLYAMMDRIKAKRKKAKDIAADTKAYKLLPA